MICNTMLRRGAPAPATPTWFHLQLAWQELDGSNAPPYWVDEDGDDQVEPPTFWEAQLLGINA